jgi:tRNA(adenine34) deaminase
MRDLRILTAGMTEEVDDAASAPVRDDGLKGRLMPEQNEEARAVDPLDEGFMHRALDLARAAEAAGEVPVGAVIVRDGIVVGEGSNRPIGACDPTAHAEIIALRAAGQALGTYRLTGTTLYVTLEPCAMCASAMVHARVARLVFAATDPRAGAAGSVFNIVQHASLNHRLECTGGVLAEECGALLRGFFFARR